jgi:uncharacterized protein YndB with AHSA1/START domain
MEKGLEAKVSAEINASPAEVWKALTDPEEVKKYFFGTNVISDWKVGSPIKFTGEWEGKPYEDKGTILELIPERKLVYTYWSSFSGTEDIPENYANVSYILTPAKWGTLLEIIQDGIADEEKRAHSEANWKMVLDSLKELVYAKAEAS